MNGKESGGEMMGRRVDGVERIRSSGWPAAMIVLLLVGAVVVVMSFRGHLAALDYHLLARGHQQAAGHYQR